MNKYPRHNLESENEAGGPEMEEDELADTSNDDIEENEALSRGNNPGEYESRPHEHYYRDESPYCSCGKNLDA